MISECDGCGENRAVIRYYGAPLCESCFLTPSTRMVIRLTKDQLKQYDDIYLDEEFPGLEPGTYLIEGDKAKKIK